MSALDEEQLCRDDLAERRRERDRQREPGVLFRRASPDLTRRHAFQIGVAVSVYTAEDSEIVPLRCPECRGPVYATRDSHGERIDCHGCDARLVTRRSIEGVSVVVAGGEQ